MEIADREIFSEAEKAELTKGSTSPTATSSSRGRAPWEKACRILGRLRLESAALLQKRGKLTIRTTLGSSSGDRFPADVARRGGKPHVATHHPFTAGTVPEDAPYSNTDRRRCAASTMTSC